MLPRPKKHIVNLVFFLTALSVILLLNRPHSHDKTFAWNRIRYESPSSFAERDSRLGHGVCPGLADAENPALIVARVESDGDEEWLEALRRKYHVCVYRTDARGGEVLQVPANKGHEAMAYLTFLIDNYHRIPPGGAVFVHGARWSWHNDYRGTYDNWHALAALNVTAALERHGYHNLKCDWSASTCGSKVPQGSLEPSMTAMLEPWNVRAASDAALPRAIELLFRSEPLGRTHTVRSQCCAQFVVSRERILQHTRDEYVALRQWLLDGTAPTDDRISGRIISYLWHVLFLPWEGDGVNLHSLNGMACPTAEDCYCRLYGICDLKCRTPGSCDGQYVVPPNYRLPEDWKERRDTHDVHDLKL